MKITRMLDGKTYEIELTGKELIEASHEQQMNEALAICEDYIDRYLEFHEDLTREEILPDLPAIAEYLIGCHSAMDESDNNLCDIFDEFYCW